jgi:SET domain-containing protein
MKRFPVHQKRDNNQWVFAKGSVIHGSGLFARTNIPPAIRMVEYSGPRLSIEQGRRAAKEGNTFVFRVNRRESIDGSVKWNLGRHANHSCSPNAESVNEDGRIWLRSVRLILKEEEITYDYGYSFRDDPTPCLCGSIRCAGIIVASRHRGRL